MVFLVVFFFTIFCRRAHNFDTDGLLYTKNQLEYLIADFKDALISSQKDSRKKELFLDTFVRLPRKNEKISCKHVLLAIDLGGTYLKLGLYKIAENELTAYKPAKKVLIPRADKTTVKMDCFEWIAKETRKYLDMTNFKESARAGMTFSHPIEHESISVGKVLKLGKDFPFKPIDLSRENDPVKMMNIAFKKFEVPVKVDVILNDATATAAGLIFGKNDEEAVNIGIVLGTGTNAAYVERTNKLKPTIINTEWASFDKMSVHRSEYDVAIEKVVNEQGKVYKRMDAMLGGKSFMQLILLMAQKHIASQIILKDCAGESFMMIKGQEKHDDEANELLENVKGTITEDIGCSSPGEMNEREKNRSVDGLKENAKMKNGIGHSQSCETGGYVSDESVNTKQQVTKNQNNAYKTTGEDLQESKEEKNNPSISQESNRVLVNIAYVLNLVKSPEASLTDNERFILSCYKTLKRRTAQILMGMMVSIVESQTTNMENIKVNIAVNGSQFEVEHDMAIFYEVLSEVCTLTGLKYQNVNVLNLQDASLVGTVKVLAYELSERSFFRNMKEFLS